MEKVDCQGKILAVFISKHAREAASGRVSVSPCIRKELPVTDPVGGQLGKALRSDAYVGFREGPPTLVNIAGVND